MARYKPSTFCLVHIIGLIDDFECVAKTSELLTRGEDLMTSIRAPLSDPELGPKDIPRIKTGGYRIWNTCVEISGKKSWSKLAEARARQLACDCISLAASTDDDFALQHHRLKFFAITGSIWSGSNSICHSFSLCPIPGIQNFDMADKCWDNAIQVILFR